MGANAKNAKMKGGWPFTPLDIDDLKQFISSGQDAVVVFHGDDGDECKECKEIYPNQMTAAQKVLAKTNNVKFGRIDLWKEGEAKVHEKYPQFKAGEVPKAYFVSGKDNTVTQIAHKSIGFGSHEKLYNWVRKHTSYPWYFPPKKDTKTKDKKEL